MINKSDYRSAISWCKKNEVENYFDSSGKYVIEGELGIAYNRPVIERYKAKYGNSWEKIFELCAENKLHLSTITVNSKCSEGRYKPLGDISKSFSKRLKN